MKTYSLLFFAAKYEDSIVIQKECLIISVITPRAVPELLRVSPNVQNGNLKRKVLLLSMYANSRDIISSFFEQKAKILYWLL